MSSLLASVRRYSLLIGTHESSTRLSIRPSDSSSLSRSVRTLAVTSFMDLSISENLFHSEPFPISWRISTVHLFDR
jgi:hypothetical protein